MTEIPTYWLVLSALFFLFNIILFIAIAIAAVYAIGFLKALQPRMEAIESSVQDTVTKVNRVADKVEEAATNLNETVIAVGAKARNVAGSAEIVAHTASTQFERFSPLLAGVVTALRVLKVVNQFRGKRH